MVPIRSFLFYLSVLTVFSCARPVREPEEGTESPRWFRLDSSAVIVISPHDGSEDTIRTEKPLQRLVCMSTSYLGCLEEIGAGSLVKGVSGLRYVSDSLIRSEAVEVGYDAQPDYERILSLRPDLLIAYSVSSAEPRYLSVLRSLGVPVAVLYDHLETHPLARAEYVRLFGALTGRREVADSVFAKIREAYHTAAAGVAGRPRRKVLVNIPYGDEWFIPGGANYLTRLIEDAGGTVLGAVPGEAESSRISVETAYRFSRDAEVWLHPGWCRTRDDLRSIHPLFSDFPVLGRKVFNNNRRLTPGGGNDFWESGAARPDRILSDLVQIFQGGDGPLYYYSEVR